MPNNIAKLRNPWLLVGLALYVCALVVLARSDDLEVGDALVMIFLFGFLLSGFALIVTRGVERPDPVSPPGVRELVMVLSLVAFVAGYLIWGVGVLDSLFAGTTSGSDPRVVFLLNIARKVVVFIVIPVAVLGLFAGFGKDDLGWSRGPEGTATRRLVYLALGVSFPILLLQLFAGSAARPLFEGAFSAGQLSIAIPLCFIALVVEVGLVEEIFYRVILQSRIAAFLRSEAAGIVVASMIFAVSHAPGLILRAGDPSSGAPAFETVAYTIATLSPPAVMFGIIWSRTRNLPVLVVIHALTDLPPNLPEFIKTFFS